MARKKPDTVKSATPAFQAILGRGELPAGTKTAGDLAREMSDPTRYGYQPPLTARPRPTAPAGKGGGGAQTSRTRASSPGSSKRPAGRNAPLPPKRPGGGARPADVLPGPVTEQGPRGPFGGPFDNWPDRDGLKPAWPLPEDDLAAPRPTLDRFDDPAMQPPLDPSTLDRFNEPVPGQPPGLLSGADLFNQSPPAMPPMAAPPPPAPTVPPPMMVRPPPAPQAPQLAQSGNSMVARPPAGPQGPGMMASALKYAEPLTSPIASTVGAGQGMPPGLLDSIMQFFGGRR